MTACTVCGHHETRHLQILVNPDTGRRRPAEECPDCGFIAFAEAHFTLANTKPSPRLGTEKSGGRDHAMAELGAALLGKQKINVLLWEPGVTKDVRRISALPEVSGVTAACSPTADAPDEKSVTRIDTSEASNGSFDLTLVNEVAQTLERPAEGLAAILRSVKSNGLVIVSTDLYDGSDLDKLSFPRAPGHRWFWTGSAMSRVASNEEFHIDVRVPKLAVKKKYWRKRYVLFSQSDDVMKRVRNHFGSVLHAPSEAS